MHLNLHIAKRSLRCINFTLESKGSKKSLKIAIIWQIRFQFHGRIKALLGLSPLRKSSEKVARLIESQLPGESSGHSLANGMICSVSMNYK